MGEDLLQTLRDVTRFRTLMMIVVIGGLVYLRPANMHVTELSILAVVFSIYLLVLHFILFPRLLSSYLILGMILCDILFITVALYYTGGVESILFTLYPICIMYSALSLGYLGSFAAATAVTLSYGVLLVLTGTPASVAGFLPIQMPSFYLLAGLSGYVVRLESMHRQQADSLREMLQLERGAKEILKVTRDLNATLDQDEILPRVAAVAAQVTRLARCVFVTYDQQQQQISGESSNVPPTSPGMDKVRALLGALGEGTPARLAVDSGRPVAVDDVAADPRVPADLAKSLGLPAFLLVPLAHDDGLMGMMYLDDGGSSHRFSAEEMRLAQTFGEQAAIAIANARRYGEAQERIQDLVSEMRALAQKKEVAPKPVRSAEVYADDLEINVQQRRVSVRGRPVNLSWTEFELLHYLASNPDTAFSRETIFRKVWKQEYYISTNLVDVCVHRLRQKIERNPTEPRYVATVHGVGYMFAKDKSVG